MSRTFSCILTGVDPNETHHLLWFFGWHSHRPKEHFFERLVPGQTHETSKNLTQQYDYTPCALYFWLFSTRPSDVLKKVKVDTLVDCAMLPWPFTKAQQQIVYKGGETLSLTWLSDLQQHVHPDGDGEPLADYTRLARETYAAYKSSYLSLFTYAHLPMGEYPILAFVWLTTQVQSTNENTDALFSNLYAVAVRNQPEQATSGQILNELLTLLTRTGLYTLDRRRNQVTDTYANEDQWLSMNWFKNPAEAAFDCEDASEHVLELFYAFTRHPIPYHAAPLETLRQYALGYTAFFTMGTLNCNEEETPHAYVILLDRRYIQAQLEGVPLSRVEHLQPALVIEGTSYTEGAWCINGDAKQEELAVTVAESCAIYTEESVFRKILKFQAPLRMIQASNMYIRVSGLVTAAHGTSKSNDVCVHLLCKPRDTDNISVKATDLFTYDTTIQLVSAFTPITLAKLNATNIGVNVPHTQLPLATDFTHNLIDLPTHTKRFDVPSRVYTHYQTEIQTHLATPYITHTHTLSNVHHLTQLYLSK